MSLFGVLDRPSSQQEPTGERQPRFDVLRCHINVWALTGLFGKPYYLICDVGVSLRARTTFGEFQVAIPFGTTAAVVDLREKLADRDVATLIFGEVSGPNWEAGSDTLVVSFAAAQNRPPLRVRAIDVSQSTIIPSDSNAEFTLWQISLGARPLAVGEDAYFRFRFVVTNCGRSWNWKRSTPFGRNGIFFDFRINDTRELHSFLKERRFEDYLRPINDAYLFLMVPWQWQVRQASPAANIRYSRVLEGEPWYKYLDYRLGHRDRRALVHYWRWQDPRDLDDNSLEPRRAFMELSRDVGFAPWRDHLRMAGVLAAGVGIWLIVSDRGRIVGLVSAGAACATIVVSHATAWIFRAWNFAGKSVAKFREWDLQRLGNRPKKTR